MPKPCLTHICAEKVLEAVIPERNGHSGPPVREEERRQERCEHFPLLFGDALVGQAAELLCKGLGGADP